MTVRESALLVGGPADGLRVTVTGRPRVLQVTYPCAVEGAGPEAAGVRVEALHVYRLDQGAPDGPPRYGYDPASP
ncbi:hypothetical protein [Streptomyces laurentii]|jgi:hypothetical protein|uniref:Uncharacterized protein n=1 Tax=Streptomyces laurentii TaxID=39478 RepID=A0A160P6H9_STRLU|nr:hypothetical protein SLA_6583 [Streptomyces laurentii]